MEGTAAEAARGSSSPSQVPPSPLQHRGSTDTEVKDRCPICLDSWSEPSFVMPCLHCFCYACILRWANNKTRCPLCKRKMTTILYTWRDVFLQYFNYSSGIALFYCVKCLIYRKAYSFRSIISASVQLYSS
uniref:RING-type E3 ubiquitin transferase n=1 Tax=Cyanistes caeruleus TaxID=156563 RepID=A0A8C0VEF7_CYACU